MCHGKMQGPGAYNEVAQGVFQIAVDKFAMLNKGVEHGLFGFSTKKARHHIKGTDLDDLVDEACHQIANVVFALIDNTEFTKPFIYWLFPNCQMVLAINAQDLP